VSGLPPLDHIVRLGDYANGKFSNSALYEVVSVEHDREGVSLVLQVIGEPQAPDYPKRHFHVNIPTGLVIQIAARHAEAQNDREFYGHDPWPPVAASPPAFQPDVREEFSGRRARGLAP
jgi:hypothetical protein